ncbi:MAG TPA: 2-amino-4-hydroxy-6-hydroxymethyldihydropteridine diphosphokinase [Bryobacteraceae bacterium]|nr:2-amino-4-hydroxy-6-hydroxymethyldihydropteridine diphosphokinase [Bryobacteraceae bacterium]
MKTIFLGLGSNVGRREEMLQAAIDALHSPELRVRRISPVYETEPLEMRNQRWFLNLVVEAETSLFPRQLLFRILKVEARLGRKRLGPNGPRTIDIDILFYGQTILHTTDLVVPHPRLASRRFVLAPMADLAPEWRDPVTRRSMSQLLDAVSGQEIRKTDFQPVLHS